jgi:exonuclease SbcD
LYQKNLPILVVSGNHDSAERLNFGNQILKDNKIYIAGTFSGQLSRVDLEDAFGRVHFYMLPFIKPANVSAYYGAVDSYHEAVKKVIEAEEINTEERNILIAHQFVTSGTELPEQSDSEQMSLGGIDNVDVSVFDAFDYVALGHIHRPQKIGRDTIRYSGSPLKYSFSEANHVKSVTMVEIFEKGTLNYELIPLIPVRDMRMIKGPIEKLIDAQYYSQGNTSDYIHATITNEEEIYDAIGQLRSVYPNIMKLEFENSKTRKNDEAKTSARTIANKQPMELFEEFYENQNNIAMTDEQMEIMKQLMDSVLEKGAQG